MNTQTFNFHSDPGHGWLEVSREQLRALGIESKISGYSYQRGDTAYLEEDLDAIVFLRALKETGVEPEFRELVDDDGSFIRNLPRFTPGA